MEAPQVEAQQQPTAAGAAEPVNRAPQAAGEAGPEGTESLESLRQEVQQWRDRYLRCLADSRNAQQRALREKAEAIRFAEGDFARKLLVIADDLQRTLESARSGADRDAVIEGVRIVWEHLLKVLRDHGIEPIEALGRPFDPHFHEALMQEPSTEHPPGTVIREVARGFRMHDRVLRPARVVVSSGPPQPPTGSEPAPQAGENPSA